MQAHGIVILFYFLDERLIPNPPMDIQISEEIDTRIGFFGHVILNISWESPRSMQSRPALYHIPSTLIKILDCLA